MSKRISLSDEEIRILDTILSEVLADGGDYVVSGQVGKLKVQNLLRRLGIPYDVTKRKEP